METRRRPVPLEHYLYTQAELFLLYRQEEYRAEGMKKAKLKAGGGGAPATKK